MYREQLSDYLYEKAKSDWESQPKNKRGAPPEKPYHPKFTEISSKEETEERNKDIPPDIDNFGDFNVEWME